MKNAKTSKNEKVVKNITNSANQKRQTSNQKRAKTFRKAQTRRRPLGSKTSWKNVETKNEPGEAFWACQTTPSTSSSPLITRNNSIMTKKKNENKNVIKNAKTSKHQKYQKRHKKRQQKRDTKHDEHHKSRKIVKSSNTPTKRSKKRNNNKKNGPGEVSWACQTAPSPFCSPPPRWHQPRTLPPPARTNESTDGRTPRGKVIHPTINCQVPLPAK